MLEVLFVEDDPGLVFFVERFSFWKEGNYQLKAVAANGKEALELLHKEPFQVVLTDIRMPLVDGLELLRRIREEELPVQVILASDYSDFRYAKEGLRLGAVDYLEKPYTEEKLKEAFALLGTGEKELLSGKEKEELYQRLLEGRLGAAEELFAKKEEKEVSPKCFFAELLLYFWNRLCEDFVCLKYLEEMPENLEQLSAEQQKKLLIFLEQIVENYDLREPMPLMNRIGNLLEEGIGEPGALDRLSEEMELSKDYLNRLFKEKWGVTISEYGMRLKINRAKNLLVTTNYKVYEIAERLGYTTVDYFGKIFKNYVGCTPFQYRKRFMK